MTIGVVVNEREMPLMVFPGQELDSSVVKTGLREVFTDSNLRRWMVRNPTNLECINPDDKLLAYYSWILESENLTTQTEQGLAVMAGMVLGQESKPKQEYRMSLELSRLLTGFKFQDEHGIKFDILAGSPEMQIVPGTNLFAQDLWIKITSKGHPMWISPLVPYIKGSNQPPGMVPALDKLYKTQAWALTSLGSMPVSVMHTGGSFPEIGLSNTWSGWMDALSQHQPERQVTDSNHEPDYELSKYLNKIIQGRGYTQISLGNGYKSRFEIAKLSNLEIALEFLKVAKSRIDRVLPSVENAARNVADIYADYVASYYLLDENFRNGMTMIARFLTSTWPGSLGVYYHKFAQQRVADWVEYHGINIWNTDKEIQHF